MAKMTAWLQELEQAYNTMVETKKEVEAIFNKFKAHAKELSATELAVYTKYQDKFDYIIDHPFTGDDMNSYGTYSRLAGEEEVFDKSIYDEDVTSRDKSWAADNYGQTYSEYTVKWRKREIAECAMCIRDLEQVRDEFLAEFDAIHEEKIQITAPKTKKTTAKTEYANDNNSSFMQRIRNNIAKVANAAKETITKVATTVTTAAKKVYTTVKQTVKRVYYTAKTFVSNTINSIKNFINNSLHCAN